MIPAMPSVAPAAPAPVSAPVDSAPMTTTYNEPTSTPSSIESELDAALGGEAPPSADNIVSEPVDFDAPPDVAEPEPATPVKADEPAGDEPPAAVDPAAPPKPEVPVAGLPEGVRLRTVDGKKAWVVDPVAGEAAFARSALVDKGEQILGEPLTEAALQHRQNLAEGFAGMTTDLLSDQPQDQLNVVDHLAKVIRDAQERGEIGHDALGSMVRVTIDSALSNPELSGGVLSHITGNPAVQRQMVNSLYEAALNEADPQTAQALWQSTQWIDKKLTGALRPLEELGYLQKAGSKTLPSYTKKDAPAAATPATAAPAAADPASASLEKWVGETRQSVRQEAILSPVDELVKSVVTEDQAKQFPSNVGNLKKQLQDAVITELKKDPILRTQIETIEKRARVAVNPQFRDQLKDEMVQRHVLAAKRILREVKGPILNEYATLVNAKFTQQRQRAAASTTAGRQAPPSGGPSASRQERPPASTAKFTSNSQLESEMDAVLGS